MTDYIKRIRDEIHAVEGQLDYCVDADTEHNALMQVRHNLVECGNLLLGVITAQAHGRR